MKYFISFDFEGLAGVSNWKETIGNARFNQLATDQLNKYIQGILNKDPKAEIVVADSHSSGENLIWEDLPEQVCLVKGYPRTFYMVEGLDAEYDAFILFGYHSPIGHEGNMDHTYSASSFYEVKINGQIVDEAFINTLVASYYNVPLKFFYADSASCEWLKSNISHQVLTLSSKIPISRFAAAMKPLKQVLHELEKAGETTVQESGFLFQLPEKFKCEVKLADSNLGYSCAIVPGITIVDARTISFEAKDPLELYRYIITLVMVCGAAKK